jgi:O-antigen/teichoic acid export membrane protein
VSAEAEEDGQAEAIQEVTRPALLQRIRWLAVRRVSWGVVDQAVSSLTNFAVGITVARTLGAEQFGAFALAYVTYAFALNASRGLATDPLMVRFSGTDLPTWRRTVPGCAGTAVTVGLVTGLCMVLVAMLLPGAAGGAFFALGLALPGLLLQDSWRYSFFALGRGGQAFLNDLIWAAALIPALLLARFTDHSSAFWFVLAWGAAAYVAAGAGVLQTRLLPRPSQTRLWLSQNRDLGFRYLAEGTSSSIATQLRSYGIGGILGLAAVGYVQAASMLMGPFMIVLFGTGAVIVPEFVRLLRRAPRRLWLAGLAFGGALATLALTWGIALMLALPRGLGSWLLGDLWQPTYPLVPLAVLAVMGGSMQAGAGAALHALGAARRSLRAMLQSSAVYLALGLGGAALGGTVGTMRAAAIAAWIGAALWFAQLQVALREAEIPRPDKGRWRLDRSR